jgi:hypothetical protein
MFSSTNLDPGDFPLLSRLRLSDEEFVALCEQGVVRNEKRGAKKIFRLRFRLHGRQHVRYVSPQNADALVKELNILQRKVRAQQRLRRAAELARKILSERKRLLAPLLEARGYHFHGFQIRRCRINI